MYLFYTSIYVNEIGIIGKKCTSILGGLLIFFFNMKYLQLATILFSSTCTVIF